MASGQAMVSVPCCSFPLGIKKIEKFKLKCWEIRMRKRKQASSVDFFFSFSSFFHSVFLCYRFYILSFSIDLYFYSMYFFYKYSFAAPFFASFASVLTTLFPSSNFLLSLCEYQTVLIAYSDQWTYVNLSCP